MELFLQNACICCYDENQDLKSLTKCNFMYILNCLVKIELNYEKYNICEICHNMLRKIDKFKKCIEENNRLFKKEVINTTLLAPKTNLHNCKISEIGITWTSLEQTLEHEVKNKQFKHEIKVEVENDFDLNMEPLEFTPTEDTQATEMLPVKNKKPRTGLQANYEGKIKIITISIEELANERQEERKNKKYLQLPYKCSDCIVAFEFEETLNEHMDKKHNAVQGSLVCTICKSVLRTQLSFNEHCKRHLRRYECVDCGKRSKHVYPMVEHYNERHGCIPVHNTCKICNYSTDSNRRYRYHMDKHRTGKVQCKECSSTFVNNAGLKNHMRVIHKRRTGELANTYNCDVCGKRYRRRNSLHSHARTHAHTHAHTHAYCAQCGVAFRSQLTLKNHLKTHSRHITDDVRRFVCDECGKKFVTKRSLQEHIDFDHLKNTRYKCDKCSKAFKSESSLKRHTQYVHQKVRPPRNKMCDYCGRGFTTTTILRSHIRTHTGERPLQCPHCVSAFAHAAALYTHKKLLHAHTRNRASE